MAGVYNEVIDQLIQKNYKAPGFQRGDITTSEQIVITSHPVFVFFAHIHY